MTNVNNPLTLPLGNRLSRFSLIERVFRARNQYDLARLECQATIKLFDEEDRWGKAYEEMKLQGDLILALRRQLLDAGVPDIRFYLEQISLS